VTETAFLGGWTHQDAKNAKEEEKKRNKKVDSPRKVDVADY
jgi:hypothetical protein